MKRTICLALLAGSLVPAGCGTTGEAVLRQASEVLSGQSEPSQAEISSGLKQALEVGLGSAAQALSKENGFFGNEAIKILFPPEARKVENTLRSLGAGSLCDDLIKRLNSAAEEAAGKAKPIFVSAIKQMTIKDATNILFGDDDAATQYLRKTTSAELDKTFRPVIKNSLDDVNAPEIWNKVFTRYNQIPTVSKVNPDLEDYITQKALDGLFLSIAQEEKKIRENPAQRTTALLKKVFGYKDRKEQG